MQTSHSERQASSLPLYQTALLSVALIVVLFCMIFGIIYIERIARAATVNEMRLYVIGAVLFEIALIVIYKVLSRKMRGRLVSSFTLNPAVIEGARGRERKRQSLRWFLWYPMVFFLLATLVLFQKPGFLSVVGWEGVRTYFTAIIVFAYAFCTVIFIIVSMRDLPRKEFVLFENGLRIGGAFLPWNAIQDAQHLGDTIIITHRNVRISGIAAGMAVAPVVTQALLLRPNMASHTYVFGSDEIAKNVYELIAQRVAALGYTRYRDLWSGPTVLYSFGIAIVIVALVVLPLWTFSGLKEWKEEQRLQELMHQWEQGNRPIFPRNYSPFPMLNL